MKKIGNNFTIKLCSDCDFKELVADVYWKNHPLAMLSYDNGPESIEIEIYAPPEGHTSWKLSFEEYINLLEVAKNYLLEKE